MPAPALGLSAATLLVGAKQRRSKTDLARVSEVKAMRGSIYDEAISLLNEPIQPERREEAIRESAGEIARKRWGMEVRSKPGDGRNLGSLLKVN
jgi:hypothetical protein